MTSHNTLEKYDGNNYVFYPLDVLYANIPTFHFRENSNFQNLTSVSKIRRVARMRRTNR